MKMFIHGVEQTRLHLNFALYCSEPFGFKVQILFNDTAGNFFDEERRNVTEIHNRYNMHNSSTEQPRIAFESTIHCSGNTYDISKIREIHVEFETMIHDEDYYELQGE